MADRVSLTGSRITVEGRLTERVGMWVISRLVEATERKGMQQVSIDFGTCTRAWPEGMAPIICQAAMLRESGCEISIALPQEETLRRLFLNTNWAHLIAPHHFDPLDIRTPYHLPATWYDATTQQEIVNRIVEIVMGNVEIERSVLAGLEWSVNEITDNVLVHADSPLGGLVQAMTQRNSRRVGFVVADPGRGILASMREGFPALHDDAEAIGEAIKKGVTRDKSVGQGNGLAGTLRVATMSGGSFSILSGCGMVDVYADSTTGEYGDHIATVPTAERYQGTVVSAELDTSSAVRIEDALGFQSPEWEPFDYIDAGYTTSDGRALVLRLTQETAGFGSRRAGAPLRMKCLNLLRSGNQPLLLDWEGVPLVSSSFADEAIGKLYVELGPLTFGARVHCTNMEPLVKSLVENAIVQRMGQHGSERTEGASS